MWRDEVLPEKKERKYPGGDITGVLASHVGDPAYQQPYMVVVEKEKTIGYCGLAGKV
jgi:hypothetical protein